MNLSEIHLHLVSDASEGTLTFPNPAASALYPGMRFVEHIHPPIRSLDLLISILKEIERQPGIVLYSLSDPAMIHKLNEACGALGCLSLAMPKPVGDAGSAVPGPELNSLIRLQVKAPPDTWFRTALGIFAGLLALLAVWMSLPSLIRSTVAFLPARDGGQPAVSQVGFARASALIGLVRGDLWADYAMALASEALRGFEDAKVTVAPPLIDQARSAAKRAAELAPHDSRVWLLIATLDSQIDKYKRNVSEELKTSYYTGPNERALRPLRIRVALASDAITDPDLQALVTFEIRTIIMSEPALKPSIVTAYRRGSTEGRQFLEGAVASLDPSLLNVMHEPEQHK